MTAAKLDVTPFLEKLPDSGSKQGARIAVGGVMAGRDTNIVGNLSTQGVNGDLVGRILDGLAQGPKTVKDFLHVGESIPRVFDALAQLQSLGYVEKGQGDQFYLTPSGGEANTIAKKI